MREVATEVACIDTDSVWDGRWLQRVGLRPTLQMFYG